ncbi:hypothetical protein [Sanguibacter sp. 25GB23B1]|uniref:hypothetical protein n=1 Tax=unclassified Sanguibacter TaxID=2645534 RepID=UPI0032AF7642
MSPSSRGGRHERADATHLLNQEYLTTLADLASRLGGVDCSVSPSTEGWRTIRVEISAGSRSVLVFEDNGELVHSGPESGHPVPLGPVGPEGAVGLVLEMLGVA